MIFIKTTLNALDLAFSILLFSFMTLLLLGLNGVLFWNLIAIIIQNIKYALFLIPVIPFMYFFNKTFWSAFFVGDMFKHIRKIF